MSTRSPPNSAQCQCPLTYPLPSWQTIATRHANPNSARRYTKAIVCQLTCYLSLRPRRHILLQPRKHLTVPELAVARLQHPVAFVGEVDETRFHPLAFQRRE